MQFGCAAERVSERLVYGKVCADPTATRKMMVKPLLSLLANRSLHATSRR